MEPTTRALALAAFTLNISTLSYLKGAERLSNEDISGIFETALTSAENSHAGDASIDEVRLLLEGVGNVLLRS